MSESRNRIRIGSRGSELALWQANWVKEELEKHHRGLEVEVLIIRTTGDKILDSPLSTIGGKGVFTKEIENALLDDRIDLAVHSLKDLPTSLPEGLTIGSVTRRHDVRDVFVANRTKSYEKFEELPSSATIATGSLRRKCQLLRWMPELSVVDVRGNLNTRLRKLDESDWDGMILARAGLVRLGMEERITEVLTIEQMLPAVGQGALALEVREDDPSTRRVVAALNHRLTEIATRAERSLLRHLEGGCQIPIGAYGRFENNEFVLDAMIGSIDGKKIVRGATRGPVDKADQIAIGLAETLLEGGGEAILESIRGMKSADIPTV